MEQPKEKDGTFTYADYLTWPEGERWELIDGVAYNMSPAPVPGHQLLLLNLVRRIADITDDQPCEPYLAPFDVRLSERNADDEETTTIVQPDISVFCNPELIDERGAHGAPDLVVEILSPSTGYRDQTEKLALYERFGVREYWIVNGDARWVMVYRMGPDDRFTKPDYYREDEAVHSGVLNADIPLTDFLAKNAKK